MLKDFKQEYIICSAIYYNDGLIHLHQPANIKTGFVVCGRRHHNCYKTVAAIVGLDEVIKRRLAAFEPMRDDQGFLTNFDRYVNRKEAMKIAQAAGQLLNPALHEDAENELTSEDLFLDKELYSEDIF